MELNDAGVSLIKNFGLEVIPWWFSLGRYVYV
jgi:hypothetical protein